MGRTGSGVERRANSIRIRLSVNGQRIEGTLKVDGRALRPTPANLKYAARIAAEIRQRVQHGTYHHADYFPASRASAQTSDTVAAVLDRWYRTLAGNPASTLRGYRSAVAFWKREIGRKPVAALVRSDILEALASEPAWSGKTRNNKLAVLRPALELALADHILSDNPAAGIAAFAHQRPAPDPFSAREREQILDYLREHCPEPVSNYYEFCFYSGVRTSEGLGLAWPQVDLNSRQVLIAGGLVDGEITDRTKTARTRLVDLPSPALSALMRQAKYTRMGDGRVFSDPQTGEPWASDAAPRRKYWIPALKRLGIRYRDPYNVRHTRASLDLMANVNPAWLAGQLGHSIAVLLRVYARWIPGDQDAREMSKIEAQIAGGAK